jgi:glycosyltransferase involved in cell wall biosynthesis
MKTYSKNIFLVGNSDIVLYKFRKELIESLKKNYSVFLITPSGIYEKELQSLNVNILKSPTIIRRKLELFGSIKIIFFYLTVILKYRPKYILSYTVKPNIFMGLLRIFLRFNFIPTVTGLGSSLQGKNFRSYFMKTVYRFSLIFSKNIVFQNKYDKEFLFPNSHRNNIKILNGSGVNPNEYLYVRNEFDFNTFNVLFIGRIMKEKGIEEYLNLVEKYHDKNSIKFFLCGSYEERIYEQKIELLIKDDKLTYMNYLKNTIEIYKRCNILINPSYHEGLSNTILESMAMGLVCIGSNINGIKEIIDNSINGYLFEKKNINDLYSTFEYVTNLDANKLLNISINAREKVVRDFNRLYIVEEYLKLLEN